MEVYKTPNQIAYKRFGQPDTKCEYPGVEPKPQAPILEPDMEVTPPDPTPAPVVAEVIIAPAITRFAASRLTISPGSPVDIISVFEHGLGTLSGVGKIESGSLITVNPSVSTSFVLTVLNPAGQWVKETLNIVVVPDPRIIEFSASSVIINEGSSIVLMPRFSGGSGVIQSSPPGVSIPSISGQSESVTPLENVIYILSVSNILGVMVSESLNIQVEPPV